MPTCETCQVLCLNPSTTRSACRADLIDLNGASATDGKTAVATADGDYQSDRYLVTPAARPPLDRRAGHGAGQPRRDEQRRYGRQRPEGLGASVVGFEGTSGSASIPEGDRAACMRSRAGAVVGPGYRGDIQVEARTTDGGAWAASPTHAVRRARDQPRERPQVAPRQGEPGGPRYAAASPQQTAGGLPSPPPPAHRRRRRRRVGVAAAADDDEATDGDDEEPAVVDAAPPPAVRRARRRCAHGGDRRACRGGRHHRRSRRLLLLLPPEAGRHADVRGQGGAAAGLTDGRRRIMGHWPPPAYGTTGVLGLTDTDASLKQRRT